MTKHNDSLTYLKVPVPPNLEEALGYDGKARYVAFYWEPAGDEAMFDDGRISTEADWRALLIYLRHPTTEPLFVLSCWECQGRGTTNQLENEPCPTCGGAGQVLAAQGFFSVRTTCPHCRGEGIQVTSPCPACRGRGTVLSTVECELRIPPGVTDGSRLVKEGLGNAGVRGGRDGDLHVITRLKPHPVFERYEDDVICELPITFSQAALGARVVIPTLDGKAEVTIPPGIGSGEILRLRGQGFTRLSGRGRGDLLIKVVVETPKRLSARQRELFEELAKLEKKDRGAMPKLKSFLSKLKEYFGYEP